MQERLTSFRSANDAKLRCDIDCLKSAEATLSRSDSTVGMSVVGSRTNASSISRSSIVSVEFQGK